jgi:rare lipoprotein A
MPLFGLVWVTSWVGCFLASSQGLLKVPNYLANAFPASVLSAVSSPLEIPTPVFPTQLYSEVWPANYSVTTVPNLALQTVATNSQFRPQLAEPSLGLLLKLDATKNTFCPSDFQPKTSLPIVEKSAFNNQTAESTVSKATFPYQILQAVQNLLPWRQREEVVDKSLASSVVVISTLSGDQVGSHQNSEVKPLKRGFWRYAQMLASRSLEGTPRKQEEQFQVCLKGRLIAQLPKQQQAELMAQRLKQFLSDPKLNVSSIEPAIFDGVPGVKVDDLLLVKVDDDLAKSLNRNRTLLAIEWANNLRVAIGKEPLLLAEAQRRMHNLLETSNKIKGRASWYGPDFHGRLTATGETYNQQELTAAHPSLPFDTYLKVKNLENGSSVIVRINDRGPYVPDRSLDLSLEAARCINSDKVGVVPFEAVVMKKRSGNSKQLIVMKY